jgi:hypothetical protein
MNAINNVTTPIQPAVTGIKRGLEAAASHAETIAEQSTDPAANSGSLAEPVVGLLEARNQVQASVKALEADTRMLGSLLDVEA